MKFKFIKIGKASFIKSKDLYAALELDRKNYYRWLNKIIENQSLIEGRDYFLTDPERKVGAPNKVYLLSMEVSRSVCIQTRTTIGKKIRENLRLF